MLARADARSLPLAAGVADCCVTSPPYWGLRDYGTAGQLGLEATPDEYVRNMVEVFREVRRVLRDDGTLWLNLGDCYAQGGRGGIGEASTLDGSRRNQNESRAAATSRARVCPGFKAKDMIGVPWRLAFALQADGWWLRSDIVWSKPNPMPEPVTDRPTKAHEYVFLLAKSERYYYDAEAIREPVTGTAHARGGGVTPKSLDAGAHVKNNASFSAAVRGTGTKRSGNKQRAFGGTVGKRPDDHLGASIPWEGTHRNKRSVWTIGSEPYKGAHFATMPTALVKPCVLAGSRLGGIVLDPFVGSGTVGRVAEDCGRRWLGFDLSPDYLGLAGKRTAQLGLLKPGKEATA